jgi:hypothetical protein
VGGSSESKTNWSGALNTLALSSLMGTTLSYEAQCSELLHKIEFTSAGWYITWHPCLISFSAWVHVSYFSIGFSLEHFPINCFHTNPHWRFFLLGESKKARRLEQESESYAF